MESSGKTEINQGIVLPGQNSLLLREILSGSQNRQPIQLRIPNGLPNSFEIIGVIKSTFEKYIQHHYNQLLKNENISSHQLFLIMVTSLRQYCQTFTRKTELEASVLWSTREKV